MAQQCFHCVISGRVQGVRFRTATQSRARALKVTGWVTNLANGCVEVYACGDALILTQLRQWLQRGPPLAQVNKIEYLDCELILLDEFEIR